MFQMSIKAEGGTKIEYFVFRSRIRVVSMEGPAGTPNGQGKILALSRHLLGLCPSYLGRESCSETFVIVY